jgi:hypothetical protein
VCVPGCVLQRASAVLDRFAAFCRQWLAGSDVRLSRAAAQTLGFMCEVEGAKFGRRVSELLPLILAAINAKQVSNAPAANGDDRGLSSCYQEFAHDVVFLLQELVAVNDLFILLKLDCAVGRM